MVPLEPDLTGDQGCGKLGVEGKEVKVTEANGVQRLEVADRTYTITMGPAFYEDHISRECIEGRLIKQTKKAVTVEFDACGIADLLSDARYYSDCVSEMGPEMLGVQTSARAVVKKIRAQWGPEELRACSRHFEQWEVEQHDLRKVSQ